MEQKCRVNLLDECARFVYLSGSVVRCSARGWAKIKSRSKRHIRTDTHRFVYRMGFFVAIAIDTSQWTHSKTDIHKLSVRSTHHKWKNMSDKKSIKFNFFVACVCVLFLCCYSTGTAIVTVFSFASHSLRFFSILFIIICIYFPSTWNVLKLYSMLLSSSIFPYRNYSKI